uniref:Immunoglobulin V-set domain-containing protein n=1 Tax=Lates calcarifer TaxID=8187 RepID=A0A4W6G4G8_LATCA
MFVLSLRVIGGNITAVQGGTVFRYDLVQNGPPFVNGRDDRFQFIGNFSDKNGSIQLSNVTLLDEGVYTCIFILFPSGNHETKVPLNLLVCRHQSSPVERGNNVLHHTGLLWVHKYFSTSVINRIE